MTINRSTRSLFRTAVLAGAITAICTPALAQDAGEEELHIEEIITTGTRIRNENIESASPITTIGQEEIALKQTPNIERVFRDLPITIPGDGENVNNGTAGQATLDLRGLGPERSLILIDGKRLAPYDINGIVTTDVIPINMLKRVDVVTGGASAVYGSDAMSGAVNFILRDDFEGVELEYGYSETDSGQAEGDGGGNTDYMSALFGVAFDDGRGHMVLGASKTTRGSILLADRSFGLYGVASSTGSGLGSQPPAPAPECSGNNPYSTAHSSGVGSTTAVPATLNLRSGTTYQFRDNGDLIAGACARHNFNPFNYYQTPQDRWQATTIASYDYNDSVEFYARATFSSNRSDFQIAPSGTFGTAFLIPVMNPFLNPAARTTIVTDLNTGAASFVTQTSAALAACQADPLCDQATEDALAAALAADPMGFNSVGITDVNGDGIFDENDAFTSTARRRTIELGPRSGIFDTDYFQYVLGMRGSLPGKASGWNYDLSFQRGVSDFVETRDGFTNLTNLQTGINTVSATECRSVTGVVTESPCSPINIFGPVGSITEQQRLDGYFIAIASDLREAVQSVYHASIDGTIDAIALPSADDGLSVAVGFERQEMSASSSPDECLKLAPASCQGGAGGNRLPVQGTYEADDYFVEIAMPLVQGKGGFENLSLEAGFRSSDYDVQGSTDSWKAGLSWEIVPGFRLRAMQQQAVRVANVGELFRPITTGLDNATLDPCSIGPAGYVPPAPGSDLFNRCVATGMLPTQVGTVPDIISGQINVFAGTNPNALPTPEEATTSTIGFVWEADFGSMPTTISLDYYDIEINDYIDQPTGQEALDTCYVLGDPVCLAAVVRIGGSLGETGTGVPTYYTNFERYQAEGVDLVVNTGFDLGGAGELALALTAHQYLTNEFLTTPLSAVVDCKGVYGTSCDPVPEFRSTLRANWMRNNFDASLLWRYIGGMDAQSSEAASLFPAFRSVSAQSYFDLTFGYVWNDMARVSLLVANVLDEDPPILGNETGSTSFNSGNTFPSLFDTMGRTYSVAVKLTF